MRCLFGCLRKFNQLHFSIYWGSNILPLLQVCALYNGLLIVCCLGEYMWLSLVSGSQGTQLNFGGSADCFSIPFTLSQLWPYLKPSDKLGYITLNFASSKNVCRHFFCFIFPASYVVDHEYFLIVGVSQLLVFNFASPLFPRFDPLTWPSHFSLSPSIPPSIPPSLLPKLHPLHVQNWRSLFVCLHGDRPWEKLRCCHLTLQCWWMRKNTEAWASSVFSKLATRRSTA